MKRVLTIIALLAVVFFTACEEENGGTDTVNPEIQMEKENITTIKGGKLVLKGKIQDNDGLDQITIESSALGVDTAITVEDNRASYDLEFPIQLATDIDYGTYSVVLTVTDVNANFNYTTVNIQVGDLQLYAYGSATLNGEDVSNAMPMTKHEDALYTIELYSEGGESFMMTSSKGEGGLNYGADSENSGAVIEGDDAEPITLEESGYYDISFNFNEMTYTAEKVTNTSEPLPNLYVIGWKINGTASNPDNDPGDWDPSQALALNQDANNPHKYSIEIIVGGDGEADPPYDIKFLKTREDAWDASNQVLFAKPYPEIDSTTTISTNYEFSDGDDGTIYPLRTTVTSENIASDMGKMFFQQAGTYAIRLDTELKVVTIEQTAK